MFSQENDLRKCTGIGLVKIGNETHPNTSTDVRMRTLCHVADSCCGIVHTTRLYMYVHVRMCNFSYVCTLDDMYVHIYCIMVSQCKVNRQGSMGLREQEGFCSLHTSS